MNDFAEGIYEKVRTLASIGQSNTWNRARSKVLRRRPRGSTRCPGAARLRRGSPTITDESDADEQVVIVNEVLRLVQAPDEQLPGTIEQLVALDNPLTPRQRAVTRPVTPLSQAALLTNAVGRADARAELRAELATADRVDLLCAFVKWHGLRLLEDQLDDAAASAACRFGSSPRPTWAPPSVAPSTSWSSDFGAEVQDQLRDAVDAAARQGLAVPPRHRLRHRLRRQLQPLARPRCSTAWSGTSGCPSSPRPTCSASSRRPSTPTGTTRPSCRYDPDRDARTARRRAARPGTGDGTTTHQPGRPRGPAATRTRTRSSKRSTPSGRARPAPQPRGRGDRHRQDRHRGAGLPAARDARPRLRLLFVAHRQEILEQSLRTYREVLADGTFGELYVGGARPERWRHVFASVQSLPSYGIERSAGGPLRRRRRSTSSITPRRATYRRLLDHLRAAGAARADRDTRARRRRRRPRVLRRPHRLRAAALGRARARPAVPVPLLRRRRRRRPAARRVEARRATTPRRSTASTPATTLAPRRCSASCATRSPTSERCGPSASASRSRTREYMAESFSDAGIPSRAVSGDTSAERRPRRAGRPARAARSTCLFAVDLFNEGLDVPEVDTSCSCGRPRAPPSSCSSSAAGCAAHPARRC